MVLSARIPHILHLEFESSAFRRTTFLEFECYALECQGPAHCKIYGGSPDAVTRCTHLLMFLSCKISKFVVRDVQCGKAGAKPFRSQKFKLVQA